MTDPNGTTTNNTAEHGSTVAIQGGHVHDNTVYQEFPGDPPAKKYEVGVRFEAQYWAFDKDEDVRIVWRQDHQRKRCGCFPPRRR